MNPELLMVFLPGCSWILFALGGTEISSKIKGQKWIRRFLLPVIYGIICLFFVAWYQAILVTGMAIIGFSLGYGDSKSWLERTAVAGWYSIISLPIGLSFWNVSTGLMFLGLFWLSNNDATKEIFVHKIWEGTMGLMIGIQLAYVLIGKGWVW